MKKIGFVIPWYGDDIPGGAEADLRGLAKNMKKRHIEVEILTTCVKEFVPDWSKNYHKPGVTEEGGLLVRRFPVRAGNMKAFDEVNYKLMKGLHVIRAKEEKVFVEENVNSPMLYQYIREHKDEYSVFAFIPYLFGTTYYGVQECLEKAVLIPCFHDESYAYLKCFRDVYSKVAGMAFHAKPEYELACQLYDMRDVKSLVVGGGMNIDVSFDADRFRDKYGITEPFILYAGRKDAGKNIYTLLEYFREYKARKQSELKLVLLGGGEVSIPQEIQAEVKDLGFVPIQDKYDAYAAASIFCNPSANESFSIVIMESWLCETPVLVNEKCAVTQNFVCEASGGLYFKDYVDFEGAVNYLLENKEIADTMAKNGKEYVQSNFAWDTIVEKYYNFFQEIAKRE
ncbi:MAG: glycosyltransferase family 4 protein [Lachnospiraceae bacterium]|nr:glycosyltransferase family 4 protein [Lachnospiraceae bacterium]